MTVIGFIGLGVMGSPMARRLASAGHQVRGFNRSAHPTADLVSAGGTAAPSLREAVVEADVVITMLPDTLDVELVLNGPDGVFASTPEGSLGIDMSTIEPGASRQSKEKGVARGLNVLDAPVSGGEAGAVEGTLSIMVGGSSDDFTRAKPVLEEMGTTIVHVGGPGSGQLVKAANQLIVAGTIELVAEALVYLRAHDVDESVAVSVLAGGLAGNRILDRKATSMLGRDFTPGFSVKLHQKDLSVVVESARIAGAALPLGALSATLMGALRAQRRGGLDRSALCSRSNSSRKSRGRISGPHRRSQRLAARLTSLFAELSNRVALQSLPRVNRAARRSPGYEHPGTRGALKAGGV